MPLDSRVTTTDTRTGVEADGEVQDLGGPGGGNAYDAEVIMVIDPEHVEWSGYVSPAPYKKVTTGSGDIRFWWKVKFNPYQTRMFKVGLKCKSTANGPTAVALTACSASNTPVLKRRFSASADIFYHSSHKCSSRSLVRRPRRKPTLRKGALRKKASRKKRAKR